jgi:hypothetical protein
MDRIEGMIQKLSFIAPISRGDVPPGMEAAVALQFLDEQESQRDSVGTQKRYQLIRSIYKMTLCRMGQFYKPEDGRMIRILGADNTYMLKSFAEADFSKAYDVVIQNASALPDTKAGRIQSIVSLNAVTSQDPVFTKPEIVEMLMLGNDKGFKDESTIAVKSAEYENNAILSGQQPPEPKEWEDLLTHYSVHMKKLQERTFKQSPAEVQQTLINHLLVTEMLMWARAKKNPMFAMKLNQVEMFPVFFTIPEQELQTKIQQSMMPAELKGEPGQPGMQELINQTKI